MEQKLSEEIQKRIQNPSETFPTEPVIKGQKLILRPMCMEDTEQFLRMRNHPDVNRWFVFRREITAEEHIAWINEHLTTSGDCRQFMIYAPHEDGLSYYIIGCTNLKNIDLIAGSAEYGVFIADPNVRGKGYGTETLSLMIKYAFEHLGLKSVLSRVFTDNIPSFTHFERGGFTVIKELKDVICTDGTKADMYLMELRK